MRYAAVDLPDCWGVDLSAKLSPAGIRALAGTPLQNGQPIDFVWRYIPLPGNDPRSDIDADEAAAWCSAVNAAGRRVRLLLVQHCRAGTWEPSAAQGQADGEIAAQWARKVGYPADAHVALDDEAVKLPGVPMRAHAIGWSSSLRAAALPCIYEGFSPGLTPEEEFALPNVDRYWGALGPWDVATRSVCCRQGQQIRLAGVDVDLDHAFPDKLGGVLRAMALIEDESVATADPVQGGAQS